MLSAVLQVRTDGTIGEEEDNCGIDAVSTLHHMRSSSWLQHVRRRRVLERARHCAGHGVTMRTGIDSLGASDT